MAIPKLDAAAIGWPVTRLGISFFPVYLAANDLPAITTGATSGLVVDELEAPSVQALRVRNPGDQPVLVVEGEHFVGGKQNRAVNATVLVPALADLRIPVSCLEQGRWGRSRTVRRDEAFTAARVRAVKDAGVAESMRGAGSRDGDQATVWSAVDDLLHRASQQSDTAAAADVKRAARHREPSRAAVIEKLAARGPLPGQCGIVVVQGRRVTAMDLFGAPHLLAAHWGALIRSHLLEPPAARGNPSATRVLKVVRRFASARAQETPGIGLGVEHRVAEHRLTGHALTLNGAMVHAAFFMAFPPDDKTAATRPTTKPSQSPPRITVADADGRHSRVGRGARRREERQPVTRDDYLRDPPVERFIEWLRPLVRGDAPFRHEYWMLKPVRRWWSCDSPWDAFRNYEWRGSFESNQETLDRLATNLRRAVERGDREGFVKAALATLKWGGVKANNAATLAELGRNALPTFRDASRLLDPSRADTSRLDGVPYMNSGWTKVYSLLLDELPMYDGRVGAALGYLVWLCCVEQRLEQIPEPLRFRWHPGQGGHNRDPSRGTLQFPMLNHGGPRTWADCNVRAAWILGAVRDEGRFGDLDPRRRLRALEAALFMIGYELPV